MPKDFKRLQDICINEVKAIGIQPGIITEWKLNYRAKSRWGLCTRNNLTNECKIQISARLIEDDQISEQACKETMIHEILHTCQGVKGHTGLWKQYAEAINKQYGYHIKRATSGEEKGVENYHRKRQPYKYFFRCKGCGNIIKKKRACKFTHYYKNYRCTLCGTSRAFVPIHYLKK